MRYLLGLACFFVLSASALADDVSEVEKLLKERFPNLTFQSVERAPIKGLYEIHAGTNIIYTDRDVKHLIFGEIYTVKGKNLTAEKRQALFKELTLKMAQDFPKDAIHLEGKKPTVFLVADTDCPFCRRELQFLLDRGADVRLILHGFHPESFAHAAYVLTAKDKRKALRDVISGRLDGKGRELLSKLTPEEKKEVESKLKEWEGWVKKYGIKAVPFAVIPERQLAVQGARLDVLSSLYPIDLSRIDLSKAPVVVGSGKGKKVVVVTDPTCPFCKKACNALRHYAEEGKATFYVFFLPVHGSKSEEYLADIFNAPKEKRPELLKEFFEGKAKPSGKPFSPAARAEFEESLKVVRELGATATPTFIFENGTRVSGAQIEKLSKLIEGEKK